jgi:hypothetical protein
VLGDPVNLVDSSLYVDTAIAVGFVVYDITTLALGCGNWGALRLDAAGIFLPGIAGLGHTGELLRAARAGTRELGAILDATGKVHGPLPKPAELRRYDPEDLARLGDELRQSVQKRIQTTVELGSDYGHSERLAGRAGANQKHREAPRRPVGR